ncbi:MAG TPA: thioesterase domain-containing protein, partial [Actinomycetota bacterium]|nr:thioesterase domain-containing protein [Actinomycetota bacterium]
IKLRGYRIELGEIDTALEAHPGVAHAVTTVRGDGADKRLVAYVVARSGAPAPAPSALRAHLLDEVPSYMVPSAFVTLESLPLTPSGKVDHAALPAPDDARPDVAASFVAPRTETERRVAALFAELLGVEQVGVDDSFFELGGSSLAAVRLVKRMRDTIGAEVSLRAFYAAPTVAHVAALVDGAPAEPSRATADGPEAAAGGRDAVDDGRAREPVLAGGVVREDAPARARHGSNGAHAASNGTPAHSGGAPAPGARVEMPPSIVPLKPSGTRPPLFLAHPSGGSVFTYFGLVRHVDPDQPLYGIEAAGLEGDAEPLDRMERMAARYVEAIRTLQPDGPYLVGGWSVGASIALEIALQLRAQGCDVPLVAAIDGAGPTPGPRPGVGYLLWAFAQDFAGVTGTAPPALPDDLDRLEVDAVMDALRRNGNAPPDVDVAFLRNRFRVFAATVRAEFAYLPPPYDGHVGLVRAQETPDVASNWRRYVASVDERVVPGNHYTMWSADNAAAIARALDELVRAAAVPVPG